MARKLSPKQPRQSLIADLLSQQNAAAPIKRKEGTTALKQYFLIVCEGEASEPNYFNALRDTLPPHLAEVVISGEGRNTIGVVQAAIKKRDSRTHQNLKPKFDVVYAVFDKDDHHEHNFNEAIVLANKEGIFPAYSNEAFELWYVLHFQYLDTGISRKEYEAILEKILGNYRKNSKEMYLILQEKGDEKQAIKWAKKLLQERTTGNPAKDKPVTMVFEIVERLKSHGEE